MSACAFQYPGSALYVYNNAVFTPEDWHGIQEIARSRKKDDPLKVGRFGIGFNSVYHITGAVLAVGKWGVNSAKL